MVSGLNDKVNKKKTLTLKGWLGLTLGNLSGVWYFLPACTSSSGSWYSTDMWQKWCRLLLYTLLGMGPGPYLFSAAGAQVDRKETDGAKTFTFGPISGAGGLRS